MDFIFKKYTIGPLLTNCYVFGRVDNAVMVDPGGSEISDIITNLNDEGVSIKHILATHGHFDHIAYADDAKKITQAKVYMHSDEKNALPSFIKSMTKYGLPSTSFKQPDIWFETSTFQFSDISVNVIHVPGHTPGSVIYTFTNPITLEKIAIVGDCVFEGSVGRVDFPFSSPHDMNKSLQYLIKNMPKETIIHPGHGNSTVWFKELNHNPYIKAIIDGNPYF